MNDGKNEMTEKNDMCGYVATLGFACIAICGTWCLLTLYEYQAGKAEHPAVAVTPHGPVSPAPESSIATPPAPTCRDAVIEVSGSLAQCPETDHIIEMGHPPDSYLCRCKR